MARGIGTTGLLLVVAAIAVYVAVLLAQEHAARRLCEAHPAGSRMEDLEHLGGTLLLTRMGPLEDRDDPGARKVIYCASLTLCDTSCSLEIDDRVVKRATFSEH